MTSEVCMMNRLAVVLAADSATTVSRWVDGKREERYFKGANKVFQLSDMDPVGLMIFDSADLLNVPWEIIIKSFRSHIKGKTFNKVDDYAKELFVYISDNPRLFPIEVQHTALFDAAKGVAYAVISEAIHGKEHDAQKEAIDEAFKYLSEATSAVGVPECIEEEHVDKVVSDLRNDVEGAIRELITALELNELEDFAAAAETCLQQVVRSSADYLDTTGLVFAGFGDHEIFPTMIEYQSNGMVGGKHLYTRKTEMIIDHQQPAWLKAFAQTSMIDTFNAGVSFDVYSSMMVELDKNLKAFAQETIAISGGKIDAIDDLDSLVQVARQKIGSGFIDNARKEHSLPMRSVLSVLPANEMAELAETLITLQSLKEKVTKPSATVGGPVDVAIITKSEGLVWVKRKHFFNADINSRFHLRQLAQHS